MDLNKYFKTTFNFITNKISNNSSYELSIYDTYGSIKEIIVSQVFNLENKNILIITSSKRESRKASLNLHTFLNNDDIEVINLELYESIPYSNIPPNYYDIYQYCNSLYRIIQKKSKFILVTSIHSINQPIIPLEVFEENIITLFKGYKLNSKVLKDVLLRIGYQEVVTIDFLGSFTIKSNINHTNSEEIIEIFSSNNNSPIRIKLIKNIIQSINFFKIKDQLNYKEVEEIDIIPQTIFLYPKSEIDITYLLNKISYHYNDKDEIESYKMIKRKSNLINALKLKKNNTLNVYYRYSDENKIRVYNEDEIEFYSRIKYKNNLINILKSKKTQISEIILNILMKKQFPGIHNIIWLIYKKTSIMKYLDKEPCIILYEPDNILKKESENFNYYNTLFNTDLSKNHFRVEPNKLLNSFIGAIGANKKIINLISLTTELNRKNNKDLKIPIHNIQNTHSIKLNIKPITSTNLIGSISVFLKELKPKLDDGYKFIIYSNSDKEYKYLNNICKNQNSNLKDNLITIIKKPLVGGFISPDTKLIIVQDLELFGKNQIAHKNLTNIESSFINDFNEINKNDYVVHIEHGIGKYLGVERIKTLGSEKDMIKIEYQSNSILYIPVEKLDLIQKYSSHSDYTPKIDKIGSIQWRKTKSKVTQRIEEMAQDIIKHYAERSQVKGIKYPTDTQWQKEFENKFPYEETEDQLKAINDIKVDMESEIPMNRLVCGDVGYGKTEVCLRAIFKAIIHGKQVVLICPTTILAQQHYNNSLQRFTDYPSIRICLLSRFVKPKDMKNTIQRILNGEVDFIIATHKILSKKIKIPRLGLLVIDEEQKFGVSHKEQLSKLSNHIDIIKMSATPIPRTLNMALSKMSQISLISTPPKNRLPIKTYMSEIDDDTIRDAIYREISRNGQVYYIFNNVQGIEKCTQHIQKLMKDIKIVYLHAKMDKNEIESIYTDFVNYKYQVLISTIIIESGVDIKNVNTIIIENAQNFGLSQLYQLRGRVGRSSNQAYCYLLYPGEKKLLPEQVKKLKIISDYKNIGSGFKIAMKDLEIRGSGNILGKSQTGNIKSIGFATYSKILNDMISKIKSDEIKDDNQDSIVKNITISNLTYDGYIPESYIKDEGQKLDIYKRIAEAQNTDHISSIIKEINDRFGKIPTPLLNLIILSEIKIFAKKSYISTITEYIDKNYKVIKCQFNINFIKINDKLRALVKKFNPKGKYERVYLYPGKRELEIKIEINSDDEINKLNIIKDCIYTIYIS